MISVLEQKQEKCITLMRRRFLPDETPTALYYIVMLRWPVGSRMLHHNTTVIRRVTTVRTERGVRLTVCQGDVS